jgi:hypothetical protein
MSYLGGSLIALGILASFVACALQSVKNAKQRQEVSLLPLKPPILMHKEVLQTNYLDLDTVPHEVWGMAMGELDNRSLYAFSLCARANASLAKTYFPKRLLKQQFKEEAFNKWEEGAARWPGTFSFFISKLKHFLDPHHLPRIIKVVGELVKSLPSSTPLEQKMAYRHLKELILILANQAQEKTIGYLNQIKQIALEKKDDVLMLECLEAFLLHNSQHSFQILEMIQDEEIKDSAWGVIAKWQIERDPQLAFDSLNKIKKHENQIIAILPIINQAQENLDPFLTLCTNANWDISDNYGIIQNSVLAYCNLGNDEKVFEILEKVPNDSFNKGLLINLLANKRDAKNPLNADFFDRLYKCAILLLKKNNIFSFAEIFSQIDKERAQELMNQTLSYHEQNEPPQWDWSHLGLCYMAFDHDKAIALIKRNTHAFVYAQGLIEYVKRIQDPALACSLLEEAYCQIKKKETLRQTVNIACLIASAYARFDNSRAVDILNKWWKKAAKIAFPNDPQVVSFFIAAYALLDLKKAHLLIQTNLAHPADQAKGYLSLAKAVK